jgi:RNA polymerase sigma-70 factor (ECF subfamily)
VSGRIVPFRRAVAPAAPAAPPTPVRGTEQQFRELVLPHLGAAWSLARYLSGDAAAAEDIVQEAMLKAHRALGSFRGESARAWVLAIVRNAAFDWRRRHRGWSLSDGDEALAEIADSAPTPEHAAIARGEADALRGAIAGLPEPFRETLVLRELDELSYNEIAAVTGAPVGTVMSRLARARRMLAKALGLEGAR